MSANTNFGFLAEHSPIFLRLAQAAECSFTGDPNTTLIKFRQLGEVLGQDLVSSSVTQFDDEADWREAYCDQMLMKTRLGALLERTKTVLVAKKQSKQCRMKGV